MTPSTVRTRRRATRPAGSPVSEFAATDTTVAPAEPTVAPAEFDLTVDDVDVSVSDSGSADSTAGDSDSSSEGVAGESEKPSSPTRMRRRLTRQMFGWVALACVVIALLGATAWILVVDHRTAQEVALRERLLAGARQTALNMTTLQADTAEGDVDRLLAGASGDFLAQFQDRQSDFVDVVGQAGVNSTGNVVSAGIESIDGSCAVTLVGADAQVSNKDETTPSPRSFRFRITMCENDGKITATAVDFVP
ncbi:MAG: hypothetical protein ACOH2Q_02145 [Rhodococcus sp. (in: high G+C Gram-positive bacteria)]